jgi:hypothetical protein
MDLQNECGAMQASDLQGGGGAGAWSVGMSRALGYAADESDSLMLR